MLKPLIALPVLAVTAICILGLIEFKAEMREAVRRWRWRFRQAGRAWSQAKMREQRPGRHLTVVP